jgi:hypothetical protein
MSKRSEELELRRRALELRSERLRRDLAADAEILGGTVAKADRVIDGTRRYGSPALLLLGGLAVVILLANPARSIAWASRALVALSVARRALGIFRNLRTQISQPPPRFCARDCPLGGRLSE